MKMVWGLTHILQVLRIIFLMNLLIPKIVLVMGQYFKIAGGDIDFITSNIPLYINARTELSSHVVYKSPLLQEKYMTDYELGSPYILLEMEAQIFMFVVMTLLMFVPLLVLTLLFKKVACF